MNLCDQPGVNDGGVQTAAPHALDLRANKFSLENARELALYARMAYDEQPDFQNAATDTQGIIRDLGDCVIVAFRGTTNLRDAITDAQAWFVHTEFGRVHYGVDRAWRSVAEKVYGELPTLQFQTRFPGRPFSRRRTGATRRARAPQIDGERSQRLWLWRSPHWQS
jgi:hypothetical protein